MCLCLSHFWVTQGCQNRWDQVLHLGLLVLRQELPWADAKPQPSDGPVRPVQAEARRLPDQPQVWRLFLTPHLCRVTIFLSHFTARRRFLQTSHLLRPPATKILPTATQPLWRLVFIPRGLRRRPEGDRGHQTHHLLLHWPSCPHCWSCPLLVVF